MSSAQVDKIITTYRTLSQIPAVSSGKILQNGTAVSSIWSQRNLDKGKISKFLRTHIISSDLSKLFDIQPTDISNQLLTCRSASSQFCGIIRDVDNKQFLEVWTNENLKRSVDLKSLNIHGDVYTDGDFASFQFSPDETKLLYVAEKKEAKTEPFIKRKPLKNDNGDQGDASRGQEYVFIQDWGEQLVGKKQSVIVQYDIDNDTVQVLDGIPENVCPAKPIWSPDGDYIVGVSYKTDPRKLGLIYCTNRLSTIFKLDFNGNYLELNIQNKSVKEPRFTLDGKTLIWLQKSCGGPHAACMMLVKTNLPLNTTSQIDTIVNIVENTIEINNNKLFYGLYTAGFSTRCWASNNRLLLSTNQKNTINSYVIDIDSGIITELEYANGSQIILDVYNDKVLVNRRNFFKQDSIAIGELPEKGQESAIVFNDITSSEVVQGLETCTYHYMDLSQESDDKIKTFSAIYVGPESGSEGSTPLIVWPHGGPHSAFANNLSLETSLFLSFGYAVLLVNFRGSIGAGQSSVEFLLGNVGTTDVLDCVLATKMALEKYPWLSPNHIGLIGGSHGGFLVTHLSGQYPDMFKVVVARNPVIDIASMSVISDIPDWCFVEVGSDYSQVGEPNNQLLVTMRERSPIQHAHKVKAPTLLQIGSKDLRVPPHQATDYYHRLKANSITVKMNLYDDNHPLGSVPNEIDNLINSILWIEEHMGLKV